MDRRLLIQSVRHGYWYNCLQEALYRRTALLIKCVHLVAACGAVVAAALGKYPALMGISIAAAAACGGISRRIDPSAKVRHFKHLKCKFLELREQENQLSDEDLNMALLRLQSDGEKEKGLTWLANPATNMARREMGYRDPKDFARVTLLQSLAAKLVR